MTPASGRPPVQQVVTEAIELVVAPAAIERALHLYEQLQPHDTSVVLQARKILTQHIFGMVDLGRAGRAKASGGRSRSLEGCRTRPCNKIGPRRFQKSGENTAPYPSLMECDQRIIRDGANTAFNSRRFEI